MAELLCSRYVPIEKVIVRSQGKNIADFKKEGYDVVLEGSGAYRDIYKLSKPPMLEMVFREGERDYVFNMIKEAQSFFKKDTISEMMANQFTMLIVYGEIKVTILPDNSYTLK